LGANVTLIWPATTATLSIDHGIGQVSGKYITITPTTAGTITYSLSATKDATTTTESVTVEVLPTTATSPEKLTIENHWLANTGGRWGLSDDRSLAGIKAWNGNVQNFLTDIGVFADPDIHGGIPIVYTLSYYDETGLGNYIPHPTPNQEGKDLDACYYDGVRLGKGFSGTPAERVDSLSATSVTGLTANVVNFYGRFFNYSSIKNDPPPAYPADPAGPYVELGDGRKITLVEDPTAVDFDLTGRLWIADNGPDQNIKIFDVSGSGTPSLVDTFGETGGVFAGPIRGAAGDFRFWGIRGIAHDAAGHIYVGCTGMPMQTIGGTDIRMFSADGTTMLWQAIGTYLDNADADPFSAGTSMYVNGKHYTMDYSKEPGKSWSLTGVTLDPFRYTDDPRVKHQFESPWMRRINGQKFLFLGNMYGGSLSIYRFEPDSEIAVPAAFLNLIDKNLESDAISPLHPVWTDNEDNKRIRWWWRDGSGDGHFQSEEFGLWDSWTANSKGIDIDDAGGIWFGGDGQPDTYFRGGGLQYWPCTGVDANGVPEYDFANPLRPGVPDSLTNHGEINPQWKAGVVRLKYLSASDTMFLASSGDPYYMHRIYRYDHFLDPARQTLAFDIDTGFNALGVTQITLDLYSGGMTLPWTFTADEDYIYVAYLDNGRDARQRCEVTIYDAHDGHQIGWLVPGDEVGNYGGAVDLINGINVTTDATGHKIIMVEEDGAAKVMVYRWLPPQPDDTFGSSRLANFAGPEQSDDAITRPDADPDAAGVTNLQRYAFGLAAHGPVAAPTTGVGTTGAANAQQLTITFPRRATGVDLSYIVEASNDLQTWDPIQTYGPGTEIVVTAIDTVPMSAAGVTRRFLRVRVQLAP